VKSIVGRAEGGNQRGDDGEDDEFTIGEPRELLGGKKGE
jgi:hypothetical protein